MVGENPPADFKHQGKALFAFRSAIERDAHDLAQFGRFGAVYREHQGLLEKWIDDPGQIGVKRNHTTAASFVRKRREELDECFILHLGSDEHMSHAADGACDGVHRKLQQDCSHGSTEHNEGSRRLQNLADLSALDQQAGDDADDGQNDSANAAFVHRSLRKNRRTAARVRTHWLPSLRRCSSDRSLPVASAAKPTLVKDATRRRASSGESLRAIVASRSAR